MDRSNQKMVDLCKDPRKDAADSFALVLGQSGTVYCLPASELPSWLRYSLGGQFFANKRHQNLMEIFMEISWISDVRTSEARP